MTELMQDPTFFYAVAFTIFVVLAFVYVRKPVLQWLDGEIAKIRSELDTARDLRAEAEAALADSKAKQARAEDEARMIVDMAKREVDAMRKKAEADLAASLVRHQQLAAERIRMAQAEAMDDVRKAAVEAALKIARTTLTANMSDADAAKLVDQAIGEIPALKAEKQKAA